MWVLFRLACAHRQSTCAICRASRLAYSPAPGSSRRLTGSSVFAQHRTPVPSISGCDQRKGHAPLRGRNARRRHRPASRRARRPGVAHPGLAASPSRDNPACIRSNWYDENSRKHRGKVTKANVAGTGAKMVSIIGGECCDFAIGACLHSHAKSEAMVGHMFCQFSGDKRPNQMVRIRVRANACGSSPEWAWSSPWSWSSCPWSSCPWS